MSQHLAQQGVGPSCSKASAPHIGRSCAAHHATPLHIACSTTARRVAPRRRACAPPAALAEEAFPGASSASTLNPRPTNHITDVQLLSQDAPGDSEFQRFADAAQQGNLVPLYERVMSDQLTPVLAYRCLVREDDREAPSFLFESVVNGDQQVPRLFGGPRSMPTCCTTCCTGSLQLHRRTALSGDCCYPGTRGHPRP